ncbi:MAG: phytoene/squalene synthase family protein [Bacteroidales bacterium]|nr:MAG: phytoene/squalene synthase family protein [Bacteroidales bacterium]
MDLYLKNALKCSKITANNYSTSFSTGIRVLNKKYRKQIYAIYGFVRFADEIVDSFYDFNRQELFENFKKDTYKALNEKISSNPILHSFQYVVNEYDIDKELVDSFLNSMEMDLHKHNYNNSQYKKYIKGSAEVVGLMCLKVFYKDNKKEYESLKYYAQKLGDALQKVNFLRDIKADYKERGRVYFPDIDFDNFTLEDKKSIEADINNDFKNSIPGIRNLNKEVRLGVYLAYNYFMTLFRKIKKTNAESLIQKRIRISNFRKTILLIKCFINHKLNLI